MNFNTENIRILEQHKHHWVGLRDVGVMINLEETLIAELQGVYNDAIGPEQFTPWCKDCVADLVRQLYVNYEQWQESNPQAAQEEETEPPQPDGKGKDKAGGKGKIKQESNGN